MASGTESVIRRVIEDGWNRGDLGALDEVVHPDYVRHMSTTTLRSREEFKQWVTVTRAAFDGFHVTIDDVITDGHLGAARTTMTGRHTGSLAGEGPTDNLVEVVSLVVVHVIDGLLVEEWEQRNDIALFGAIGINPL